MSKKWNKLNVIMSVVIGLLPLASTSVMAQYIDVDKVGATTVKEAELMEVNGIKPLQSALKMMDEVKKTTGTVSQIGFPKGNISQVKGFGKTASLIDALKVVVPKGWNAKKTGEVDIAQQVTLSGNKSWVEAVANFAEQTGVDMIVDWDQQILTVVGKEKPVSTIGIIRLIDEEQASKATAEVKPVVVAAKKWILQSEKSLRENVEAWAEASEPKYKVSWLAVNYMINAGATFGGEFDDENSGPIAKIFKLFANHDVPLKATFMEDNRVLLVENATYRQNANSVQSYTRNLDLQQ
jgi:Toxin co-regulated pilus biosynthesis protein Q